MINNIINQTFYFILCSSIIWDFSGEIYASFDFWNRSTALLFNEANKISCWFCCFIYCCFLCLFDVAVSDFFNCCKSFGVGFFIYFTLFFFLFSFFFDNYYLIFWKMTKSCIFFHICYHIFLNMIKKWTFTSFVSVVYLHFHPQSRNSQS